MPYVAALIAASSLLVLVGCASTSPSEEPSAALLAEGTNRAFTHTLSTTARAEAVWALWTDVQTWPSWDDELEAATLDGPFREGARGRLRPTSGLSARFMIEDVVPGRAYTLATRLPLGWLRVRRTLNVAGDRVELTHAVTFSGLGGHLLAGRLGPRFRHALPVVMDRLRTLAEERSEAP